MDGFLALLSNWRGRSFVQSTLESRGFMIPRRYQELVANECPSVNHDLDVYWDESAREYVCSAGRANSLARSFPDSACYRSKYLDTLAAARQHSAVFTVTRLHPCFRELGAKRRLSPDFDRLMISHLELEKHSEISHRRIQAEMWTGEKRDVGPLFADLMKAHGFEKWRRSFVKRSASGLVFGGFADTGGRPYCITVPISLFIAEDMDIIEAFEIGPDQVIPGFWFYYRFDTRESAVLGFNAYVELIDALSDSF